MRRGRCAAAAALLLLAPRASLGAQATDARLAPELRVDALGGRGTSAQIGAGVQIPAGAYVRVGVIGAVGNRWLDGGYATEGRADVLARFLLDPFRQSRWGLSAGGGVSLLAHAGDRVRPNLLVALDLEGPRWSSGVSPAFSVGLGGGVRGGVALRWGRARAR